eukprot:s501_g9.t1
MDNPYPSHLEDNYSSIKLMHPSLFLMSSATLGGSKEFFWSFLEVKVGNGRVFIKLQLLPMFLGSLSAGHGGMGKILCGLPVYFARIDWFHSLVLDLGNKSCFGVFLHGQCASLAFRLTRST